MALSVMGPCALISRTLIFRPVATMRITVSVLDSIDVGALMDGRVQIVMKWHVSNECLIPHLCAHLMECAPVPIFVFVIRIGPETNAKFC